MALAANRGFFQWDITNPFHPRRELEATFFYFSFKAEAIKVVLEPMDRNMHYWEFSLTLAPSSGYIVSMHTRPKNVSLFIKLDDILVASEEVPDSHFCHEKRSTYRFQGEVEMIPKPQEHSFQIKIEFDLEDRETRNEYFFNAKDVEYLAHAMSQVLENKENNMNPNVVLWSANNEEAFRAHTYILYWRWNSFLREHRYRRNRDVHTNISSRILRHILRYMYCARFEKVISNEPDRYRTELFQVIDRYEIGHLYKVFVKTESKQVRVTKNGVYTESRLFPLEIYESRTTTTPLMVWEFDRPARGRESEDGQHRVSFRMQIRNEPRNWLSYSLLSRSRRRIFVDVNLEVVKMSEGEPETVIHLVGQDYTVEPGQTVESGPVGRPETFDGTEGNNFIRCFLRVSKGSMAEYIRSVDTREYQDQNERYCILSDHMCKVNVVRRCAQLMVDSKEIQGETQSTKNIHQEILRARVPEWWRGLKDGTEDRMPSFATSSILGSQALPLVFDYIYTGKLKPFEMSQTCYKEIHDFAKQTKFKVLSNWLRRYVNWFNEKFT